MRSVVQRVAAREHRTVVTTVECSAVHLVHWSADKMVSKMAAL